MRCRRRVVGHRDPRADVREVLDDCPVPIAFAANNCVTYHPDMARRSIDIDERALAAAKAELGTKTVRDTVNVALRRAAATRSRRVASALRTLAGATLKDRARAWR